MTTALIRKIETYSDPDLDKFVAIVNSISKKPSKSSVSSKKHVCWKRKRSAQYKVGIAFDHNGIMKLKLT